MAGQHSTRQQKVEETLRRAVANELIGGTLADPRLGPPGTISVTGVKVSPDLGQARVYIDVLGGPDRASAAAKALRGLRAGAALLRRIVAGQIDLRRVPELRFELDESIARGEAIERVLSEIHAGESAQVSDNGAQDDRADESASDDQDDST